MDGITDCAYRYITKRIFDQYNKNPEHELYLRTEFMNVHGYLINPARVVRHMSTIPTKTKTIAQIYWWDQEKLLEAALKIEQDYKKKQDIFYAIELNVGCPSPKVMAWWWGSGMLRNKKQTLETIKLLSKKLTIPFTIKTRNGLNQKDQAEQFDFIIEASKYCKIISIHGRPLKQSHSWAVDREFIYNIKKQLNSTKSNCKIIGNGWIKTFEDHADRIWNLDGTITGQSAIWNPRIFTGEKPNLEELHYRIIEHLHTVMACELYFEEQTKNIQEKDPKFILTMMTEEKLPEYIDKAIEIAKIIDSKISKKFFSIVEFRKFLFNYVKWITGSKEFKVKVSKINEYLELKNTIDQFFIATKTSI